jgi:zinc protease
MTAVGTLALAAALVLAGAGPDAPPTEAPAPWARTPPPAPLPPSPASPPRVKEGFLPTGLRVVVVEHHRRPIVVTRLILPRGALLDPPRSAGASWLAVALVSDYYERSPSGEELVEEKPFRWKVVEQGGSPLFDVESDFSLVGISGYAQDTGKYLKLMAGALERPRRGEESFRGRRNALLDALEDLETSDPQALGRVLAEASFGRGHPYARSIVGTKPSLTSLGLEDAIALQDRILTPDDATLLIVGDVKAEEAFEQAKGAFGKWRRASSAPRAAPPPPPSPAAATADIDFLKRQPASTLIACASRPLGDVRASDAALELLATILGGGLESRLGQALRERSGLTYHAGAEIVRRRWARALLACSTLAGDQAAQGIRLFRETLDGARAEPPTDLEVERAKAIRLGELEGAWDDSLRLADVWTRAIGLGESRPRLEEERAEIARIGGEEIRALAKAVLRPSTLRWIVSGEPRAASRAVEGNGIGRLRALTLDR